MRGTLCIRIDTVCPAALAVDSHHKKVHGFFDESSRIVVFLIILLLCAGFGQYVHGADFDHSANVVTPVHPSQSRMQELQPHINSEEDIHLNVVNRPLTAVLSMIQSRSGIKLELMPGFDSQRITRNIRASTWTQVVRDLLRGFDRVEQYDHTHRLTHVIVASHGPNLSASMDGRVDLSENSDRRAQDVRFHSSLSQPTGGSTDLDRSVMAPYHMQDLRTHSNPTVRTRAIRSLSQEGNLDQAIEALSLGLLDPDPNVQSDVLDYLIDLGFEHESLEDLTTLVDLGDQAGVRAHLTEGMGANPLLN
ncbi:MAG: hypothetical protein NPIRA02_06450 [Nitrospirales bacterium]|nr:MAG: hypothetical protein NPIRA02_06450 [Nitrospirales bacterium]